MTGAGDIEAHGFLDGAITRPSELRLAALENRIDADLRAGRHREVVAELDAPPAPAGTCSPTRRTE